MACFSPLQVWWSKEVNESGKRNVVFDAYKSSDPSDNFHIPCGQCSGCRLDRSRQWATRCLHEAQLYDDNVFITLTFDDEHLNKRENPLSLDVTEMQKFMKRLRKKYVPKNPYDKVKEKEEHEAFQEKHAIRFYQCGEYGDQNGRPHYHTILFNMDFSDKYLWDERNGFRYYRSPSLEKIWPYGMAIIGDVTFESAAYVARYIMKKINGEQADEHYSRFHPDTGELICQIQPEFTTMSRRPGIGKRWYEKFKDDLYPKDFITVNGKKVKPPKYYDKQYENEAPLDFDDLKEKRQMALIKAVMDNPDEFGYERLSTKEKVKSLRMRALKRDV